MSDNNIAVTLTTLESYNHIIGDIERGVKVYKSGGVEFDEREPGVYWARVPHKHGCKVVSVVFTRDGSDIKGHTCDCTLDYKNPPVCRHVVAAVLAIQGGIADTKLTLGASHRLEHFVTDKDTAEVVGSGGLEVLATPVMITLMERAAYILLEDLIEEGQTSVGTSINVSHTAASPVGITVEIEAKIISVKGRSITFDVSASDEGGEIGKGTHTRVIVDGGKLLEKAKRRISAGDLE